MSRAQLSEAVAATGSTTTPTPGCGHSGLGMSFWNQVELIR